MSRLTGDNMAGTNFASTQMQGRLEEFDEISKEEENTRKRIEELKKFKNLDTTLNNKQGFQSKNFEDKCVAKPKRRGKRDNNRIKSLTSLMEDTYNKGKSFQELKQSNNGQKDVQLSIFQYFTGHKEKIGDILKRIESIEKKKVEQFDLQDTQHESKILYNKNEWSDIIKNIRLRFPELSNRTKKSLKYITHKVQQDQFRLISDSPKNNCSIWSQASAPPEKDFTDEDLKWLYDLTSEQIINENTVLQNDLEESDNENPFVMTLSQVMNTTKSEDIIGSEPDVILDSSPEPSPIKMKPLLKNDLRNKTEHSSEQMIQVKNSIYGPEFHGNEIHSRQQDSVETAVSIDSFPFVQSHREEPIASGMIDTLDTKCRMSRTATGQLQSQHGTQEAPIEIISSSMNNDEANDKTKNESTAHYREKEEKEEVIISSPIKDTELFKTPTKRTSRSKNIITSPFQMNYDSSPLLIRSNSITPQHETTVSGKSSVYSTAKSKFKFSSAQPILSQCPFEDSEEEAIFSSIPPRQFQRKRKIYYTSRILVDGGLNVVDATSENSKLKIRTIETKTLPVDSENVICDSEEEEANNNSISVIEITREMDDTDDLINLGENSRNEHDTSILQVPSSPQVDNSYVLGLLHKSEGDSVSESQKKLGDLIRSAELKTPDDEFHKMSTKELKERFQEWGLKPVKGKEKMILILSETNKLIDENQLNDAQEKPITTSQHAIRTNIYNRISFYLKQNRYWLDKIMSFEPINLNKLQDWLESGPAGASLETEILEKYCDELGIAYTDIK